MYIWKDHKLTTLVSWSEVGPTSYLGFFKKCNWVKSMLDTEQISVAYIGPYLRVLPMKFGMSILRSPRSWIPSNAKKCNPIKVVKNWRNKCKNPQRLSNNLVSNLAEKNYPAITLVPSTSPPYSPKSLPHMTNLFGGILTRTSCVKSFLI